MGSNPTLTATFYFLCLLSSKHQLVTLIRAQSVSAILVTAMINRIKLFLLCVLMVTCATDYSVVTTPDIIINQETLDRDTSEIRDTEVVVEYFVQPDKPENLDVLFVIDIRLNY